MGLLVRAAKAAVVVLRDKRGRRSTMRSARRSWPRTLLRGGLAGFAFLLPVAIAWWVCPSTLAALPSPFGAFAALRAPFSNHVVAEPTSSVPTDVVFYGHVLYGGDDAYLVDGRWYRPGAYGWQVFTSEPPELAMVRRSLDSQRDRRAHALGWLHL